MNEQQQKMLASFIAGLVIGALVVWFWSSIGVTRSASRRAADTPAATSTESASSTGAIAASSDASGTPPVQSGGHSPVTIGSGEPSITVSGDQKGSVIQLARAMLPDINGWIVARPIRDGTAEHPIGASHFHDGYWTDTIELVKPLISGAQYQVIVYRDDGNNVFSSISDTPYTDSTTGHTVEAIFTAQ
jgi:hypothetical protein